jgi:hypothetical protein
MADPCKSPTAPPTDENPVRRDLPATDRGDELEPIDLDRVISDPAYRRRVIAYLNRR